METGALNTFCSGLKFSQHDRKRHRHSEGVTLGKWVSRRVCSDRYTVLRENMREGEREREKERERKRERERAERERDERERERERQRERREREREREREGERERGREKIRG